MITAEHILAALGGRSQWFETGIDDRSRKEFRRYSNVVNKLALELAPLRGDNKAISDRGPAQPTAKGKQSKSGGSSGSVAEYVSQAIKHMPMIEWQAILWSINSDPTARAALYNRLLAYARRSMERDKFWPDYIRRGVCNCGRMPSDDYVPDLVHLALLELRTPGVFSTHGSRAQWFGLSRQHWKKIMLKPYGVLQGDTFRWFGGGCTHIENRLNVRRKSIAAA